MYFFIHSAKGTHSWEKAVTKFGSQLAYKNLEINYINIDGALSNFDTAFSELKKLFFLKEEKKVLTGKKTEKSEVKNMWNIACLSAIFVLRNDQIIFLGKKVRNRINIPSNYQKNISFKFRNFPVKFYKFYLTTKYVQNNWEFKR